MTLKDIELIAYKSYYGIRSKYTNEVILDVIFDRILLFENYCTVKINGKWGVYDYYGRQIIPIEYDELNEFSEGRLAVKKGKYWGFIDKNNKAFTRFEFYYSSKFIDGIAIVRPYWIAKYCLLSFPNSIVSNFYDEIKYCGDGCYTVIDDKENGFLYKSNDRYVLSIKDKETSIHSNGPYYEEIQNYCEGLAIVLKNDKYGFVNRSDEIVIPIMYDKALQFKNGKALVSLNNQTWAIDVNNNPISDRIPGSIYEDICTVKNQSTTYINILKYQNKYGLIDYNCNLVSKIIYDEINPYAFLYYEAKKNGKYGYLNWEGIEISEFKYDSLEGFWDGVGIVKKQGLYGFIDTEGNEITEIKYENVSDYNNRVAIVEKNAKKGLVNKQGTELTEIVYDHIERLSYNIIQLSIEMEQYYSYLYALFSIDMNKIILPLQSYNVGDFSDELARIRINSKYGFINTKGNLAIDAIYSEVHSFSEGIAGVRINNLWGFIDLQGKPVTGFIYDDVDSFKLGVAKVKSAGKWALIDRNGKLLCDFLYDNIEKPFHDFLKVNANGKFGFLDLNGKELNSISYESINNFIDRFAYFKKNGRSGLLSKNGEEFYIT